MGNFQASLERIKYPALNVVYDNYGLESVKLGNINTLKSIKNKYGKHIEKWGNLLEIDFGVLTCFIAVESMGVDDLKPNNAKATGLCQVTPINTIEVISKFKTITKKSFPVDIANYLNKKASFLMELTPNNQKITPAQEKVLLELLQKDNEFNILLGAISLRWLIDYLKINNKTSLAKVILGYNQSPYGRVQKYKNVEVTAMELFEDKKIPGTKAPKETRNYIAKLLGSNGFVDLLLENKIY